MAYELSDLQKLFEEGNAPSGQPDPNTPFFEQVYQIVAQIPCGKVTTYGHIAALLGSPRSARYVGYAMRTCPEHLPWQRVVKADGQVTGGQYAALRRQRLIAEGVGFTADGRVDLAHYLW